MRPPLQLPLNRTFNNRIGHIHTHCRIPLNSNVLQGNTRTIIAVGENPEQNNIENAEVLKCGKEKINLTELLDILAKRGVKKILVEGGETVMWSFLKEQLFDEYNVFLSSMIIGGIKTPTIAGGKGFQDEKSILGHSFGTVFVILHLQTIRLYLLQ